MIVLDCSNCGGTHHGVSECTHGSAKPCNVCGRITIMRCIECANNKNNYKDIRICGAEPCHIKHEAEYHPDKLNRCKT